MRMKHRSDEDLAPIINAIHSLVMQIHTNATQKTAKIGTLHQSARRRIK
jgi:hypothetical protein